MKNIDLKILTESKKVCTYVESVQAIADSNKRTLGFLPKSVFQAQADSGRLWVAIKVSTGELLGYLLFGGRYPMLRIFHLYVAQKYRKQGVGTRLLRTLENFGEKNNYLTVSARVAADLASNKFWERSGFLIIRQEAGGKASRRTINIRYKDLNTPSLLKMMSCKTDLPEKGLQGLRLISRPLLSNPTYVLDLNVFFDVVKRRLNRDVAARIISLGLNNEIRVFVTPEFTIELQKHSNSKKSDPILEFAQHLPTLPSLSQNEIDRLTKELNAILFSDRPITEVIGTRNYSDLVHLSYCIHHRTTGFITNEKAILAANSQLQEAYLLEVLSAADLMIPGDKTKLYRSQLRANLENEKIQIGPAREYQRDEVEQFLLSIGAHRDNLPLIWHPGRTESKRRRIIARTDDEIIAVASWDNPKTLGRYKVLYIYVNERLPQAELVIDHFFESALRDAKPSSVSLITLNTGAEQLKTQSTAVARGFLSSFTHANDSGRRTLSKLTFKGLISKENWYSFRNEFMDLTGHRLPEKMPNYSEFFNTGIIIRNQKGTPVCSLGLFEFEILVSPGIVLCPGREALIVPIQKRFAENLFELPQIQQSLFPSPEALLHVEKAYFRNPTNASAFRHGKLVLFYLSGSGGGSKEVVGCARITFSEVLSVDEVNIGLARQGVLSPEFLSKISDKKRRIHAFTFDNFNLFPKRISFKTLKSKKMISGANLVTVEQLSAKNLTQICEIGFCFRDAIHA